MATNETKKSSGLQNLKASAKATGQRQAPVLSDTFRDQEEQPATVKRTFNLVEEIDEWLSTKDFELRKTRKWSKTALLNSLLLEAIKDEEMIQRVIDSK